MVLRDLHKLTHLLTTMQRDRDYYYYHFTAEETEAYFELLVQ